MFDAILRDTNVGFKSGNRRASIGASVESLRPESPDKLSSSIDSFAPERVISEDSLPPLNSSLDIISMKGRAVAPKDKKSATTSSSKEEKPVVVHTANKHKRTLAPTEDEGAFSIKIFDENLEDRPVSKKRRNSLIPMKNSSRGSNVILSDKLNTLTGGGDTEGDGSIKKHLAGFEKKPLTRSNAKLTRMSLIGSSNRGAVENTSVESSQDQNDPSSESSSRPVRATRRNSLAVSNSRRLAGRDL
jgi:hypothetical protein